MLLFQILIHFARHRLRLFAVVSEQNEVFIMPPKINNLLLSLLMMGFGCSSHYVVRDPASSADY